MRKCPNCEKGLLLKRVNNVTIHSAPVYGCSDLEARNKGHAVAFLDLHHANQRYFVCDSCAYCVRCL